MKEYTEQELAEISKEIDGMDAICEKGRKQVKSLLEKVIGKRLEVAQTRIELKNGDVYKGKGFIRMAVVDSESASEKVLIGLEEDAYTYNPSVGHMVTSTTEETMRWITGHKMQRIGRLKISVQ